MKLRILLVAFILLVGISSVTKAGMNRQRRSGAVQSTSQQTCINNNMQAQRRNGQVARPGGSRQRGNGQKCLMQNGNGRGRNGQGRNGNGGNRQGGNGQGRNRNGGNRQGGNGQGRGGQGGNRQGYNCNGIYIYQ